MAGVAAPVFTMRSASIVAGSFGGGMRRPAPLDLTYTVSKRPGSDGAPLVSPVVLKRSTSAYGAADLAASSPSWKPTVKSPRTPTSGATGSSRHLLGSTLRRLSSNERTPSSASFLTRRFSMPSEGEQDNFRALCKARFYEQDREATVQIETILKESSTTAQSCYNKILSTVRQQYHEDVSRERRENLRRIVLEAAPDLDMSKDDRKARVKSFLEAYASKEVIGTHTFLKALFTVLYLQTLKDAKGGAGGKCIEWSLQEEVFMEAGTGQWTKESVTLLKTVLAMTDVTQQDQDDRSPFYSQKDTADATSGHRSRQDRYGLHGEALSEGTIRNLRMHPSLGNPELLDLLAVFPGWISRGRPREYRFFLGNLEESLLCQPTVNDMEEGVAGMTREKNLWDQTIRISHGRIRISPEDRDAGFEGTLVERVAGWLKRLFSGV